MNLLNNKTWLNDIYEALKVLPNLKSLNAKNILITGASGLICSAVVDILLLYNKTAEEKISIFLAGRNRKRLEERFQFDENNKYIHYVSYDAIVGTIKLDTTVDYIIHGASNSLPSQYVNEPAGTILGNVLGVKILLDILKKQGFGKLLYISSSEVYGKKESNLPFQENEYGYVDILNARNSYPMGKRAAESLCAAYAREYNVQTVIARPGHIYGPTASSNDTRISSYWAYSVACGKDINMKSDGLQIRSYCYCLDCATAILTILLCGKCAEAYNISNKKSIISIKDMAKLLCKYGNVKLIQEQVSTIEKSLFNPMDNSSLNSSKLQYLGWSGIFDANTGLEHTVAILKDIIDIKN